MRTHFNRMFLGAAAVGTAAVTVLGLTATGAADAPVRWNGGHNFSIWLRPAT